jgi:hypothetical protein
MVHGHIAHSRSHHHHHGHHHKEDRDESICSECWPSVFFVLAVGAALGGGVFGLWAGFTDPCTPAEAKIKSCDYMARHYQLAAGFCLLLLIVAFIPVLFVVTKVPACQSKLVPLGISRGKACMEWTIWGKLVAPFAVAIALIGSVGFLRSNNYCTITASLAASAAFLLCISTMPCCLSCCTSNGFIGVIYKQQVKLPIAKQPKKKAKKIATKKKKNVKKATTRGQQLNESLV